MPGKVIFVVGLPGAGKSEFLKQLSQEFEAQVFDDFKAHAMSDNPAFDCAREFEPLKRALNAGELCIVADIDFCNESSRREASLLIEQYCRGTEIEWRYFANDPAACKNNVLRRAEEAPRNVTLELENVARYSEHYRIPPGGIIIPVWAERPGEVINQPDHGSQE